MKISLLTRKILRDLWINKARTVLVVLTIAVGVFAVGSIARSWVILSQNLADSFTAVNPASATIVTYQAFSDDIVRTVQRLDGVKAAEGRNGKVVRVNIGKDRWRSLQLIARADFANLEINQFRSVDGQWPPPKRTMLLERSSLDFVQLDTGKTAVIQLPDGSLKEIGVSGVVHDVNRIPTLFSYTAYGFMTLETYQAITGEHGYNTLDIVVTGDQHSEAHIRQVVERVSDHLEASRLIVIQKRIPAPGKHPLDNIIQSVLWLLAALAGLAIFLGAFLVINIISALLAQQIQQIGIIKSVGGRSLVVGSMYVRAIVIYGVMALVLSVPLGMIMAHYTSIFFALMINFDVTNFKVPLYVNGLEVLAGLVVPVLASLYPIISGTRITVREAISQGGGRSSAFGSGGIEKLLTLLRGLPTTLLYALRNTFRQKIRLVLTLLTLSMAGAIFIAVIGVRSSLVSTIDEISVYWQEDINVRFYQPYRYTRVEREIRSVAGVRDVEGRILLSGFRQRPDGHESTQAITIYGLSPDSKFLQPRLLEGRWLEPGDTEQVVINIGLLSVEPDLSVGDSIELKIQGRTSQWQIVGIVTSQVIGGETLIAPVIYTNYHQLSKDHLGVGQVNEILIETEHNDQAYVLGVSDAIEEHLDAKRMHVAGKRSYTDVRNSLESSFDIVLGLLQLMSLEFAVVGGLGLMSMMSLNVLERTREMGVLRVVGGNRRVIAQIVVAEGIFTGMLSWLFGAVLAYPLSDYLGAVLGRILINVPLVHYFPVNGPLLWLAAVIILSTIASLLPARSAWRLSVRETLAYE